MAYIILFFIIGLLFSSLFINLGFRLPVGEDILSKNKCDFCKHDLKFYERIPLISYIVQRGKCNYCHQKISFLYFGFELLTGLLFSLTYLSFINENNPYIMIGFGLVFISSLIIIMISDFKYMIISDEILIIFSALIIVLKLLLDINLEEIKNLYDLGYSLIFMFIDALIMFIIMFVIKKIGELIFKKEALGGGDIKLMAYIAIVLGYKLSIIVIFLASFLALPPSIIGAYKKDKVMLPFGPYLAIAAIILFLLKIDFSSLIELLH